MSNDPRHIVDNSPMSRFQVIAVGMCILLNALDGFDVLAISFASPGIATEWNINRAELGVVLSMELVGMAVGSIFLGGIADRYGRRPTILGCLLTMAGGMALAALVSSIQQLLLVRFITGLGIGGMMAAISAMVSEYSNKQHRSLCVMLMGSGYPLGGVMGGSAASALLVHSDWRSVFIFGAVMTFLFAVMALFLLPESIAYLTEKRPTNALEKINRTLKRMGKIVIESLPQTASTAARPSYVQLFSPALRNTTILLTLAYFAHIMTFYYIIKWIPKIVTDMQYAPATAGSVLVWANVGGVIGSIAAGILVAKIRLKALTILVMLLSFVMVVVFGHGQDSLWKLSLISAITVFFSNAGIVSLYALFVQYFPATVRASGTGFVIGVGRGGAASSPTLAGVLFTNGLGLQTVSIFMAGGALCGAMALLLLKTAAESPAFDRYSPPNQSKPAA